MMTKEKFLLEELVGMAYTEAAKNLSEQIKNKGLADLFNTNNFKALEMLSNLFGIYFTEDGELIK